MITIVVFVTGAIGFNIRRAVLAQRFRSEVDLLVDTMRLAQDLMLILRKDTHLRIRALPNGQGIEYLLAVEGGVPKEWDSVVIRSKRQLESTHYADFLKLDSLPTRPGEIDLHFQSQGSMMSHGELRLATHEDPFTFQAERRSICLKGYPHPLESVPVLRIPRPGEEWVACKNEEDQDFYERLTLYTQEEILADAPPNKEAKEEEKPVNPSPQLPQQAPLPTP